MTPMRRSLPAKARVAVSPNPPTKEDAPALDQWNAGASDGGLELLKTVSRAFGAYARHAGGAPPGFAGTGSGSGAWHFPLGRGGW